MAAEAPAAPPAVSVEDMPKLTLNVLEMVKTAQQQNGLRHDDYHRYRQYCSRRLRRVRKSVGLQQGKGKVGDRLLGCVVLRAAAARCRWLNLC